MAKIKLGDNSFECSDVAFVHMSTVFLEAVAKRKEISLISLTVVDEQSLLSFSDSLSEFIDGFIESEVVEK